MSVTYLGDVLAGERLQTVNRILRWHGLPAATEGMTITELWQSLVPMELDRFCHVVGEITDALEGKEGVEEDE